MASTAPNEQGWNPDLIELQLAHAERNRVRAPASRLAERRKMMQAWATISMFCGEKTILQRHLRTMLFRYTPPDPLLAALPPPDFLV
jgi:hypothetical protein